MACAVLLALLPLIELVDHWEAYGSDPEFVSVCTVLGIAVGSVLLFRRAFRAPFRGLMSDRRFSFLRSVVVVHLATDVVPTVSPPVRAPIRI